MIHRFIHIVLQRLFLERKRTTFIRGITRLYWLCCMLSVTQRLKFFVILRQSRSSHSPWTHYGIISDFFFGFTCNCGILAHNRTRPKLLGLTLKIKFFNVMWTRCWSLLVADSKSILLKLFSYFSYLFIISCLSILLFAHSALHASKNFTQSELFTVEFFDQILIWNTHCFETSGLTCEA